MRFVYVVGITSAFFCLSLASCKTTTPSVPQSLTLDPKLTYEDWVKACTADLNDSKDGDANRRDLKALAGTEDCGKAYPAIKTIFLDVTQSITQRED